MSGDKTIRFWLGGILLASASLGIIAGLDKKAGEPDGGRHADPPCITALGQSPDKPTVENIEPEMEPVMRIYEKECQLFELDITDMPSPNYIDAVDREINKIVLHTTEGSGDGAIAWHRNPASKRSAHYVVKRDGSITRLVDEEDIAWHVRNQNDDLLGIEMEGTYKEALTKAQIESTGKLVINIQRKYKILFDNVVAHSDLDYKSDPGEQNMKSILDYIEPFQ